MRPSGITDVCGTSGSFERAYKLIKLRIRRRIKNYKNRGIAATQAICRKLEFFLPTPLTRSGNGYSNVYLIGQCAGMQSTCPFYCCHASAESDSCANLQDIRLSHSQLSVQTNSRFPIPPDCQYRTTIFATTEMRPRRHHHNDHIAVMNEGRPDPWSGPPDAIESSGISCGSCARLLSIRSTYPHGHKFDEAPPNFLDTELR